MSKTQDNHVDISEILARLPLFQEMTPDQLQRITSHVREKRLGKGEMLFQKGDTPRGFFVIVFGQIKLAFPSSSGNEKVVDIVGPKQSFGESVMFIDRPYPVFAEAITDTLLLHVAKDAVFELLEKDATFARHMLAGLSMRMHSLVQDVESYSLRSSAQRVIGFLLQHCPDTGNGSCGGSVEITLPTSKQIIASWLNLTPETLSRIFHDLAEARLIGVQGKKITINDLQRLREYDL
jgi:CRP/FNR family transcriptional regulator, dissimilatory nitrate respiration regulator